MWQNLFLVAFSFIFVCIGTFFYSNEVFAVNNVQIVATVSIDETYGVEEGAVVVFDPEDESFNISKKVHDSRVYGVIVRRPTIVLVSGENEIPVVTSGVGMVRVDVSNGAIHRGDFLVTSSVHGSAMRANAEHEYVFAIAMEDVPENQVQPVLIQAEMGMKNVREALRAKREIQEDVENSSSPVSMLRGAVAAVIGVLLLVFLLRSFRSSITNTALSIGRNPRARLSIIIFAVWNMFATVILVAIILFLTVAFLILPL
jgi:hypothetical protein